MFLLPKKLLCSSAILLILLLNQPTMACTCGSLGTVSEIDTLAPGVVGVNYDYSFTMIDSNGQIITMYTDTIYQIDLIANLGLLYETSPVVLWGQVDSVGVTLGGGLDTIPYGDSSIILVRPNSITDYVHIKIHQGFKGGLLTDEAITLSNRPHYSSSGNCYYGYDSIDKWQFLNFSTEIDSIKDLSIYPDGNCRMAGGIRIIEGRIHHSDFPGVSVSMEEFEAIINGEVSIEITNADQNVNQSILIRSNLSTRLLSEGLYNLQGRKINPNNVGKLPVSVLVIQKTYPAP